MERANESSFNELHNLLTEELLTRIKSGEASTQDSEGGYRLVETE